MDGGDESIFFIFCDLNKTFIFMFKFSIEACPKMKYELVFQRKKENIFSYDVPKRPKLLKKIYFSHSKVQVSKGTWTENFQLMVFFRQTGLWKPKPPKNMHVFFKIRNPVNNEEILAPELVGSQSEMVV